jgi:glucose-1-phosphate cytidylyltransferase
MEDMKTVIFCGGKGTRLREMTEFIPKPMVPIGNMPILWHIMKIYHSHGFNKFVLCLGYKADVVKNYFLNHNYMSYDFTSDLRAGSHCVHSDEIEDWVITFADTALETQTGERLLRVKKYIQDSPTFMATYGDGVADINIQDLLKFHRKHGKIATITGGHGFHKYGLLNVDPQSHKILSFHQKPRLPEYINIGFMVFENAVFDFLSEGEAIEDAIVKLAEIGEVDMYPHEGFFHPMDTFKDYEDLNGIWNNSKIPWKVWQ